ncbi:MAG: hypothetical protein IKP83_03480 [Bacteroidales bacterium]|jgi:hypothetical protein|nr:hypothetical protein [Bacteroidales bacterium]
MYEAPQLTVVSFRAERGYAISTLGLNLWELNPEIDNQEQMESYTMHDTWLEGTDGFFN